MKSSHVFNALIIAFALQAVPAIAQDQAAAAPAATPQETTPPTEPMPAESAPTATETTPADAASAAAEPAPADAAPTAAAESTSNPAVVAAIGTPSDGKALVVFFRPSKFVGGAIGFKVRENEVELGKLRNGNYFAIEVDPGQHSYVVHSEAKDVTTIEAEAGETYFLAGSISMGVLAGRPNLSPSNEAAFAAVLPKLKKSKPLD